MQRRSKLLLAFSLVVSILPVLGCGSGSSSLSVSGTVATTATVGTAYTSSLTVSGGTAPYTWTVSGLPAGLTGAGLSTATLTISGTPTTAGTATVSISVADAKGKTLSQSVNVVVSNPPSLSVTTTSLNSGTVATAYSVSLAAANGTAPYTWAETSGGALPAGLSLSTAGVISGTPTTAGTFGPYVFTVTDSTLATAASGNLSITISATAAANCQASPALRGNEAALTLPYAFLVKGTDNNDLPVVYAGSFTPNASGGITASDVDYNGLANGPQSLEVDLASSSYSFGSDGRGCLYLAFTGLNPTAAFKTQNVVRANLQSGKAKKTRKARPELNSATLSSVTFAFVANPSGSAGNNGAITEFDDTTGGGVISTGQMATQTVDDFSVASFSSSYAFGVDGWAVADSSGSFVRVAIAGSFANASGTLTLGVADQNVNGTVKSNLSGGSGSLLSPSTTTGRGTGSYTASTQAGSVSFDFAYYVVDGGNIYYMSIDPTDAEGDFLLSGRVVTGGANTAAPNGHYILALSGLDLGQGPAQVGANIVSIGTLQATSSSATATSGTIPAATIYTNDAGTFGSAPYTNGTFTFDPTTGRAVVTGVTGTPPVAYFTADPSSTIAAFLVGTDTNTSSGFMVLQTTSTPAYALTNVDNGYTARTAEDIAGVSNSFSGVYNFDGAGNYTGTTDKVNFSTGVSPGQTVGGTITINADGSGLFDDGAQAFVTNGKVILAIDDTSVAVANQPFLYIFLQQTVTQ